MESQLLPQCYLRNGGCPATYPDTHRCNDCGRSSVIEVEDSMLLRDTLQQPQGAVE